MDNHLYLGFCLTWVSERASVHRRGCGSCTVSRACLGRHVAATLAMWLLLLCPIPCLAARVCWPFGSVRVSPPGSRRSLCGDWGRGRSREGGGRIFGRLGHWRAEGGRWLLVAGAWWWRLLSVLYGGITGSTQFSREHNDSASTFDRSCLSVFVLGSCCALQFEQWVHFLRCGTVTGVTVAELVTGA